MKERSASSLRDVRHPKSSNSTSKLVRRKGGEKLSDTDLKLLSDLKRTKEPIDYGDLPNTLSNTFENRSGIGSMFKPVKQQITLRLDSDLIAWAKVGGGGYQSRINAALRRAMVQETRYDAHRQR